ncbi:hypothetical protein [Brevibacillus parabrevis]|uniref:hypothetical protein n=1 Tax=Brevibacillus parabrevis TaxID=54914 RepID=UPI001F609EC7|nr:hypothetical protein [Brevibacillus parabrevis]
MSASSSNTSMSGNVFFRPDSRKFADHFPHFTGNRGKGVDHAIAVAELPAAKPQRRQQQIRAAQLA